MSGVIPDQKPVWDRKHKAGEHENLRHLPSSFAPIAIKYFPKDGTIVELGCGVGREAEYFAKHGFRVLASDLSEEAIKRDKKHFKSLDIEFSVHDMQNPLDFKDDEIDAVYMNLALHYFDDGTTRKIISEIWRVLKPQGTLAFSCKSVHDFHYGKGQEVEKDVFVSEKGHVRHLFSQDYTKGLVSKGFETLLLEEVKEENDGQVDNLIRCVARKVEP